MHKHSEVIKVLSISREYVSYTEQDIEKNLNVT